MQSVWLALGLTLFAGLATGIGSIIAFTASRTNFRFLSVSTGFFVSAYTVRTFPNWSKPSSPMPIGSMY